MYLAITIVCFFITFLLLAFAIYLALCALTPGMKIGNISDDNIENIVSTRSKWNIPLNLVLKIAEKAVQLGNTGVKLGNKAGEMVLTPLLLKMRTICLSIAGALLIGSIYCFALATSMYSMYLVYETVINTVTLLDEEEEFPCYALCTGDPSIDSKCTYELLFGPDSYKKLVEAADLDEYYEGQLALCETGKEKGELLIKHINNYMVSQYKSDLSDKNKFRYKDKLDREKMSDNELKDDLIKLLADHKVNGKNPNCKCFELSGDMLFTYCYGEKHWKEKWKFKDLFGLGDEEDEGTVESGDTISGEGSVGHATGNYVIQLDDGLTYYWYHQSGGCGCDHDVLNPTYGRLSQVICGTPDKNNMAGRGCSMYSTAMALSCVLDAEITPFVVIQDVLKANITQTSSGKYNFVLDGTRGISNGSAMSMNKSALASSIVEVYGDRGVHAKEIGKNQSDIDDILAKGGMVIFSYQGTDGGFPWYKGQGHFFCLRKKENGLYYKLDSVSNAHATGTANNMNIGLTWEQISPYIKNSSGVGGGLAIWKEGGSSVGSATGGSGGTPIGTLGNGVVATTPKPPILQGITDADIAADIAAGKYTREDYNYLVSIGMESGSYEGFYAVACCVRNRVNSGGGSYRNVVTAPGQFAGFRTSDIGNPRNENIKQAAVAVLRGGPSTVGGSKYFFGRVNGYDMWVESSKCDTCANIGGNVFYGANYGTVHNKKTSLTSDAMIIWDSSESKWYLQSGQIWTRN